MRTSRRRLHLIRTRLYLLYALVPALFFSYHPVLKLGEGAAGNYELSLPLIVLGFYAVLSVPEAFFVLQGWAREKRYGRFLLLLFPVYVSVSGIWSAYHIRALLTSGILWCLVIATLTIPELISSQKIKRKIVKMMIVSASLVAVFAILQCGLDLLGVGRGKTLLCQGCTYQYFGFPHPNGFAIEPQFFGNLLLVPIFIALYLMLQGAEAAKEYFPVVSRKYPGVARMLFPGVALILIFTLFLTLSRGAIYAFLVGLVIFMGWRWRKQGWKAVVAVGITGVAFGAALGVQGVMAKISPTTDGFGSGVSKVISQLTLGKIDLGIRAPEAEARIEENVAVTEETFSGKSDAARFQGYVVESTDRRVELTEKALDLWDDTALNMIFGTGVGSSGVRLFEKFPELGWPKEIVQNEYAALLLETGVVGVILAVLAIGYLVWEFRKQRLFLIIVVVFGVTLFFFSGLTNALHIYLFPVFYLCSQPLVGRAGGHKKD